MSGINRRAVILEGTLQCKEDYNKERRLCAIRDGAKIVARTYRDFVGGFLKNGGSLLKHRDFRSVMHSVVTFCVCLVRLI